MGRFERILSGETETQAASHQGSQENKDRRPQSQVQPEIKPQGFREHQDYPNMAVKTEIPDEDTENRYWRDVLTNAYYLGYPGPDGQYKECEPLRPLYVVLSALREMGAGLIKVKSESGAAHYKLVQGKIPADKWEEIKASLSEHREKLKWLFAVSALGAVMENVDLAAELPREWMVETLGKYERQVLALRMAIGNELTKRRALNREYYFRVGDGRVFYLVPFKTGQDRPEVTPEEVILVREAQRAGLIGPGVEAAVGALKTKKTGGPGGTYDVGRF